MTLDAVDCVTEASSICITARKRCPFHLFCHLLMVKTSHSVPDFVTNFLQNSDFRLCVKYFNTHEKNLKSRYKRV